MYLSTIFILNVHVVVEITFQQMIMEQRIFPWNRWIDCIKKNSMKKPIWKSIAKSKARVQMEKLCYWYVHKANNNNHTYGMKKRREKVHWFDILVIIREYPFVMIYILNYIIFLLPFYQKLTLFESHHEQLSLLPNWKLNSHQTQLFNFLSRRKD